MTSLIILPGSGRSALRTMVEGSAANKAGEEFGNKDLFLQEMREGARILGRRWIEIARGEAPKLTGALAKSQSTRTFIRQGEVELRMYHETPKGKWIVGGTRPHPIHAKNVPFMIFYWEKGWMGPGIYYFKSVNHPGIKPNDYIGRSYEKLVPEAEKVLGDIASKWVVR